MQRMANFRSHLAPSLIRVGQFARPLTVVSISLLIGCGLLSFAARDHKPVPTNSPPRSAEAPPSKSPALRSSQPAMTLDQHLEIERIVLTPSGFEPEEITRPAGPFWLAVDNGVILSKASFKLAAEAGPTVATTELSEQKTRWRQVIDLAPGQYVLTDQHHPGAMCTITITP